MIDCKCQPAIWQFQRMQLQLVKTLKVCVIHIYECMLWDFRIKLPNILFVCQFRERVIVEERELVYVVSFLSHTHTHPHIHCHTTQPRPEEGEEKDQGA